MFLCLHRNLAGLASIASRENVRFATAAVHVIDQQNGLYRVEVTDGRRLAIVQGPAQEPSPLVQVEDESSDVQTALIGVADWREGFKLGDPKSSGPLTLVGGERLVFTTGVRTLQAGVVEGRYPEVDRVIPTGIPLFAVRVDALLLAELLRVAAQFLPEGELGVQLLYYGHGKPLGVCTRNEHGQTFDALLVPLVLPNESRKGA